MADDEQQLDLDSLFPEPERPKTPPPSFAVYHCSSGGEEIKIKLVGNHPLWGHYLWNAAKVLATYLDNNKELYVDKSVLELGAGGALPSIVAALNGAKHVMITDYPDTPLLDNIEYNVVSNCAPNASVRGFIWGRDPSTLSGSYDLLILSDLIFNHSQHSALLSTCLSTLAPGGKVVVFYSHHRPHLAHKDMEFFVKAKEAGWNCEKVVEERMEPMFVDDPGEESVRATVWGWELTRSSSS